MILIIFAGFIEAFGTTLNSKFRQKSMKLRTFISSTLNILVWVYIISKIIENISNLRLIIVYAFSYALGDVVGLIFDQHLDKLAILKGIRFKKKRRKWQKKK